MVLHICVDGFSQTIIYVTCLNNNKASSALSLFIASIQNFGVLSRVRCDHGLEKAAVAHFMLRKQGLNRRSVITGRSVHNHNHCGELCHFIFSVFLTLWRSTGLLDSLKELHLFCLHYIDLPQIQRAVTEFQNQWNNHSQRKGAKLLLPKGHSEQCRNTWPKYEWHL